MALHRKPPPPTERADHKTISKQEQPSDRAAVLYAKSPPHFGVSFFGGELGIRLHFSTLRKNKCTAPSSRRRQVSTGHLHFNGSNPIYPKKLTPFWGVLFWRRVRDSNPRFLSESLVFKTSSLNHSDNSPCCYNISSCAQKVKGTTSASA